ncbi:putative coiled-coil domain-containing protein MTMR15 [Rosellinia necatrix]|uniref:Fanconi-associated nuclease n=1 Tax=Rosellinia necatrix TaxID=77044 RepID=A0A1W2TDJ8_ROSNE|nr:putative coiled-coil domain-containing protein MTMR15 [Rosellinia necatrix]
MDAFLKRVNSVGCPIAQRKPASKEKPARLVEEHPKKRVKREEPYQSDANSDEYQFDPPLLKPRPGLEGDGAPDGSADDDVAGRSGSEETHVSGPTAIEICLPEITPDKRAIEEYQNFKSSQGIDPGSASSRLDLRVWIKGKSSLYVDAFNLALDTVLDEESHLFNMKERFIFEEWRALSYEAQFLYVRLFLRKISSWHRIARLGYYNDITNTEAAVEELQKKRAFISETAPQQPPSVPPPSEFDTFFRESCVFENSFTFADASEDFIHGVEEAVSLLSLDEVKALAKEAKVQGKNKSDLAKAICRMSNQQAGLLSMGLVRADPVDSINSSESNTPNKQPPIPDLGGNGNRRKHFLDKILTVTGPCVRLSLAVFNLFERVHLVFYRSTEWTEKSLTTIILAKVSKRNFPSYIVSRSSGIFASRSQLLEFENAMRSEYAVDAILEFNGPVTEVGFRKVIDTFETIYPRWRSILQEEQVKEERVYESGEGAYLRRLSPGHAYTRIVHKAAHAFGRLKEHQREHTILTELLGQRLFHPARRGSWYQRKALLEEHYLYALLPDPAYTDLERQRSHWKAVAAATCERALEDPDCHLKYHYDLQKRLVKLEKQLKIPVRLQHDFGHVQLKRPEEHHVEGIQLKKPDAVNKNGRGPSTKTIWVDELESGGECSVESMCLSWYRGRGWKGYHAEGGIIRTLFAYLFFDIIFLYVPNVFQTAYQTCPLDLHTDAFYPTRASEINCRLVEIANGAAPKLIQTVDKRERERRTCVIGLNWDYELEDLLELADCFDGAALATVCKVMAQEYSQRGGGIPDLILWRAEPRKECMFAEVKSANDRLSDTQRLWIHILTGAGLRVALCNAVAKETREI